MTAQATTALTAYDVYDAAFDEACDHAEFTVDYVTAYAENVWNDVLLYLKDAKKILECHHNWKAAGGGQSNFYHLVKKPLTDIFVAEKKEFSDFFKVG